MGSYIYAARCRQRGDQIRAMISLETIGYFSDRPGSQKYPAAGLGLIYPRTGNFIVGFVGNLPFTRAGPGSDRGNFAAMPRFPR